MEPRVVRIPVAAGEPVVLDYWPPARGSDCAVFVHGLGSHRRGEKALHFAERFTALGWGFLTLDLRGHGESGGTMRDLTLSRCLADLAAALAWLPAPARLLIGSSMGGAVAAWHGLLHPRPGAAAVLIAPALAFPMTLAASLRPAEREAWRRDGVRRFASAWLDLEIGHGLIEDGQRYDPARLLREYAVPSLILHGMRDDAVPWRASVDFVEGSPCPDLHLLLLKNGDHRLTEEKALLFDAMRVWLAARGTALG
jgi:alpha-beta hydrolase superfamily lysophospholipase